MNGTKMCTINVVSASLILKQGVCLIAIAIGTWKFQRHTILECLVALGMYSNLKSLDLGLRPFETPWKWMRSLNSLKLGCSLARAQLRMIGSLRAQLKKVVRGRNCDD